MTDRDVVERHQSEIPRFIREIAEDIPWKANLSEAQVEAASDYLVGAIVSYLRFTQLNPPDSLPLKRCTRWLTLYLGSLHGAFYDPLAVAERLPEYLP
jgi:hypothetical protein